MNDETMNPQDDCSHPDHDWERCTACVAQAIEDEILSPGSEPFEQARKYTVKRPY